MPLRGIIWSFVFALAAAVAADAAPTNLRVLQAAKAGDLAALRAAIAGGSDVNAAEPDGATALAWAAHRDDLAAADLLLAARADANLANEYGITPLSLACANGSAVMVQRLLGAGANPNVARPGGETPLMTAARTGNPAAVAALLGRGAAVNAVENNAGQTALMWAAANRHAEVVKLLVAGGADVHARSRGGFTPLLFAAQQGDVTSARILIEGGARIDETTPKNGTALVLAGASGHPEMTAFLLDAGADPNAVDANGATALHFAAGARTMLPAVKALLARHANPNARITRANTGLGDLDLVGATPLFMAAAALNAAAMRELAAGGADASLTTKEGTTPLMVAAGVGRFEERTEPQDKAALEAVRTAAELGIDVNAVGDSRWTALHGAAYTGADGIVRFLVEKGARMDVKDTFGQTPLSIAEAVITTGLKDIAEVRPRKYRTATAELLVKLGSPSLDQAGVERLGSMAVRRPQ